MKTISRSVWQTPNMWEALRVIQSVSGIQRAAAIEIALALESTGHDVPDADLPEHIPQPLSVRVSEAASGNWDALMARYGGRGVALERALEKLAKRLTK